MFSVGTPFVLQKRNATRGDSAPMNKLPDWAERIPLIRAALTSIATEFIHRRQIGELFGVNSYQAGQLIRDMGPMLHGNSLVVDAQDIRKLLSKMARDHEMRDLRLWLAEKDAELEPARRKSKTR